MPPRILVIEDDAEMGESLKDLLALENLECAVARSGKEGLALADALQPELIITDVQLPDMSGYQICQRLKRHPRLRHAPVVMMSAHFIDRADRLQGFELGADEFFFKPFDPEYFVAKIKSILRGLLPPAARAVGV